VDVCYALLFGGAARDRGADLRLRLSASARGPPFPDALLRCGLPSSSAQSPSSHNLGSNLG